MTKRKKHNKAIRYIPPETMPFMLCSACIAVVIKNNKEASDIFNSIIDCCGLTGMQMLEQEVGDVLPESKLFLKEVVERAGYDPYKPPHSLVDGIPYVRQLMQSSKKVTEEYVDQVIPKLEKEKTINRDLNIN